MAEAYARHAASREGPRDLEVDSAGLLGIRGAPASPEAIRVLKEAGVDLRAHRSRGLREDDLATADVVVAMTPEHLRELEQRFPPRERERRFLVRAFESSSEPAEAAPPLEDPMGLDLETYRRLFRVLRPCIDHLLAYLKKPG